MPPYLPGFWSALEAHDERMLGNALGHRRQLARFDGLFEKRRLHQRAERLRQKPRVGACEVTQI